MTPLLPDPTQLREQLEHARATRHHLDKVIDWLEQGVALLSPEPPSNGREPEQLRAPEPDPPAPAAPALSPPDPPAADEDDEDEPAAAALAPRQVAPGAPARPTSRDREATVLSVLISSNQPMSKAQIADRTGLSVGQLDQPLRALLADGKATATGKTVSRRYAAVPDARPPQSEHGAKAAAGRERNAAIEMSAVQRIGVRDRVLKAVLGRPGELDDEALVGHLDVGFADVADAVAYLMERDTITRDADGCYVRTAEAARVEAGV